MDWHNMKLIGEVNVGHQVLLTKSLQRLRTWICVLVFRVDYECESEGCSATTKDGLLGIQ